MDNALSGIGGQRPNLTGSNGYCATQIIACWLNFSAFGSPAAGTLGNLGINNLESPGYFDVDVAVSRRFAIREHQTFEFRA